MEVVVVTGVQPKDRLSVDPVSVNHSGADNGDLLKLFPGGNRNANGPISRISQYRGLLAGHNTVLSDGHLYTSGGPNRMDSPMSYTPSGLTEAVTLYRGVTSVSLAPEGMGTVVNVRSFDGYYGSDSSLELSGRIGLGYSENQHGQRLGGVLTIANDSNRVSVLGSQDRADDYSAGDSAEIRATQYEREQYRLSYRHLSNIGEIGLHYVANDTGSSGTPALGMDIGFIDSQAYGADYEGQFGEVALTASAARTRVDHGMDNFSLRAPPVSTMGMVMKRENAASADATNLAFGAAFPLTAGQLKLGIDQLATEHDSDITNPMNSAFSIANFNGVKKERLGLYGEYNRGLGEWQVELGSRVNLINISSAGVGAHLAMMNPMQQGRIDELATAFNHSDRDREYDQLHLLIKASRTIGDSMRFNVGLARKERAPSYQELFLWVPMEATGGLADSHTYIGDVNLDGEVGYEVNLGLDWRGSIVTLKPELFYRRVEDFITGGASTNMTANMFAMMVTGKQPLQFTNRDARFYGIDLSMTSSLGEALDLTGNLSYVNAKDENGDYLYRIAPLNGNIEVRYRRDRWYLSAVAEAAARQRHVAAYNQELNSSGWGTLSIYSGFEWAPGFEFSVGVGNIFDKAYRDHLSGYNRVPGSGVAKGERLYGQGRSIILKLNLGW